MADAHPPHEVDHNVGSCFKQIVETRVEAKSYACGQEAGWSYRCPMTMSLWVALLVYIMLLL